MQIWEEIQVDPEKGAERLVAEYGERLYATAFRICLNETDAEDLVQRTFVQVLRRIGSFKGDSSFVTWMCAILVNFYRMDKRGKARNALVLDETEADERPDTDPDPAESLARRDEAAVLRARCREKCDSVWKYGSDVLTGFVTGDPKSAAAAGGAMAWTGDRELTLLACGVSGPFRVQFKCRVADDGTLHVDAAKNYCFFGASQWPKLIGHRI